MKVTIIGYGRMGHEVESVLLARNHRIAAKVDPAGGAGVERELTAELLKESDVAIEFSLPEGIERNAAVYCAAGVPAVVGTTGWDAKRDEIGKLVESAGIGYLYGSNFSVGAHLFFRLIQEAARLVDGIPDYDIMLYELHHNKKKDSPSGTALTAAGKILEASTRKKTIQTEKLDRQIREDELHVASVRGGSIPGIHSVLLDSAADTIEITHSARNRGGLALGAVMAAEWLQGRKGFFSVDDFIRELLK